MFALAFAIKIAYIVYTPIDFLEDYSIDIN